MSRHAASSQHLDAVAFDEPLERRLASVDADGVRLHWLGQAGFVITAGGRRLLIDPYLSDTLADKYRGSAMPHDRMMPAPVSLVGLGAIDLVAITHHHTDHMDPGTLAPLAAAQPGLLFVVPAASREEAVRRIGVPISRLRLIDAGRSVEPWPGLTISALRAAHETIERDAAGHHRFLGYVLRFEVGARSLTVLHSGDTVPFPGQVEEAAAFQPDVMLLPVNGRSTALAARGVPGNMTLDEAVEFGRAVGAGAIVAHHHGMFAFNTCAPEALRAAASVGSGPRLIPARAGLELRL